MKFEIRDMPKIQSPFVRKVIDGRYVVTPEITPGYEWVFDEPEVKAVEKLDGTNVSLIIEAGVITAIYNRTNMVMRGGLRIGLDGTHKYIIQGVMNAADKGHVNLSDGQWFGEVVGPRFGRSPTGGPNPYGLTEHDWIPFDTYSAKHLAFKSWGKYPKDFQTISRWFKEDLLPLYCLRIHGKSPAPGYIEGIVFYHPDGRMAKLRRDMFDWYTGPTHGE